MSHVRVTRLSFITCWPDGVCLHHSRFKTGVIAPAKLQQRWGLAWHRTRSWVPAEFWEARSTGTELFRMLDNWVSCPNEHFRWWWECVSLFLHRVGNFHSLVKFLLIFKDFSCSYQCFLWDIEALSLFKMFLLHLLWWMKVTGLNLLQGCKSLQRKLRFHCCDC